MQINKLRSARITDVITRGSASNDLQVSFEST